MSFLAAILANKIYTSIATGVLLLAAGPIVKYLLGKIPVEKIKDWVGRKAYAMGVLTTTLLGKKVPYVSLVWNSCIEPWVILFIETIVSWFLHEYVRGLRSDNQSESPQKD